MSASSASGPGSVPPSRRAPVSENPATASAEGSLVPLARRGAWWALAGYAGSQLIRLGGNLVLWRLLHPEAFGVMAVVNVFMQGLHMFSDVGIGPSIIQNPRGDDPDYLNTAWTIQVVRGFVLFVVATIAAAPLAAFYDQPELASLIPVVAFTSILAGFNSTRLITSTRHIALGRLTLIDLSSQAIGLAVMVLLAFMYRSIWALVIGSAVSAAIRLAMSHTVLRGIRNRLRWDKSSAITLVQFGRWIFLSTLLGFAVDQSDRLIFGKLVPMSLLGVYSIALIWASLPLQVINQVFNAVLFPLLSRVHNEGGDARAAFRQSGTTWLLLGGFLSACLLAGAAPLVRFLYDERALPAIGFIQTLAVGTWFGVLSTANATALFAKGTPKWVVFGSLAKLIGMAVLIPTGMATWGFAGAVAGFAASEVLSFAVQIVAATRLRLKDYWVDVRLSVAVIVTAALGMLCAHFTEGFFREEFQPRIAALLQGATIFVVVSSGWAYLYWARRTAPRARALVSV